MIEDRKIGGGKHSVTMENRERISITGVIDVLSFDEESIVADTDLGVMMIKGMNLHVNRLNLEEGQLMIDGEVDSLEYSEGTGFGKSKGSLFSKIFK